jgi:hypothetical protein
VHRFILAMMSQRTIQSHLKTKHPRANGEAVECPATFAPLQGGKTKAH